MDKGKKIVAIICFLTFLVVLMPILYVGIYSHPTGDDIRYGVNAHLAYEQSGSLIRALGGAVQGTWNTYHSWQGTFIAMFIMHLQPTVFGEHLYFLTPIIVVGVLLSGLFWVLRCLALHVIPMDKWEVMGLWSVVGFMLLQWIPSPGEGIYWFNGATYYTCFFGVLLWGIGWAIKYCASSGWQYLVALCLVSVGIGGSNYVTLLLALELLALAFLALFWKKNESWKGVLLAFLLMIGCFVISAFAPGSFVRGEQSRTMSAMGAIWSSLKQGWGYMDAWMTRWWFLGVVAVLLFSLGLYRKVNFSFKYPIPVAIVAYGLFCSMQCPTMFAESTTGPGRVVNVIYFGWIIMSYIVAFYLGGAAYKTIVPVMEMNIGKLWTCMSCMLGMMVILQLGTGLVSGDIKQTLTVKAIRDLVSGRAVGYHEEYEARLEYLENCEEMNVELTPFVNQPVTIYVGDYTSNPYQESNQALAKWYGKDSVVVVY